MGQFLDLLLGRTETRHVATLSAAEMIAASRAGIVTFAGVPVTEMRALQQITVWACVALISDTLSALPVDVVVKDGTFRRPIDPPTLFLQPHAEQFWPEWMGRMMVSLLLRGNCYGRIVERDRRGYPTQIFPLHPDEVQVRRNRDSGRVEYAVAGEKGWLGSDEVFHVKGMTRPGTYEVTGLSPIQYARQAIGLALASEEYGARYFGESGNPSAVLETEASLEQEEVDAMLARWEKAHAERHRRPAVTTGGLKYRSISITPEESQFLETRRYSRSEIAGFFRCPPHKIMDVERSTSWGSGIEEQNLMYINDTLGIWLVRWETALSALLPRPQRVKFNVNAYLRARMLERFQAYRIAREIGIENADEIRALEDMAPIADGKGEDYLQPLNYVPVPPSGGGLVIPEPSGNGRSQDALAH